MSAPEVVVPAVTPPPPGATATVKVTEVKGGRRKSDWHIVTSNGKSIFFWIFGMFLDEKHKPSMSRIMLGLWTIIGWEMIQHELNLVAGQPSISNACWTSWWAAEGMLSFAVFGPSIASYFGAGAAGAISAGSIATGIRDALGKVGVNVPPTPGQSVDLNANRPGES